jgi:hypothetical protein
VLVIGVLGATVSYFCAMSDTKSLVLCALLLLLLVAFVAFVAFWQFR